MTADGMNPSNSTGPQTWCSAGNTDHCPCEGNRGATLRAAADGELNREQSDRLGTELREGDAERIAFERSLREACGRAMGAGVVCPDQLKDKIRAMAAERWSELGGELVGGAASVVADAREGGRLEALDDALAGRSIQTRDRSFWSGQRALGAIAAVLVLGVGGLFVWQAASIALAPSISTPVSVRQASARDELVTHFASEHRAQLRAQPEAQLAAQASAEGGPEPAPRAPGVKLAFESQEEAEAALSARVGDAVRLPECPEGTIRLRGAGPCQVPAEGGVRSASGGHAMFNIVRDGREVAVSLFVSPARDDLGLEEGVVYKLKSEPCGQGGTRVLCWREGDIAYYLVQQIDDGEGCDRVLESMGLGSPSSEI